MKKTISNKKQTDLEKACKEQTMHDNLLNLQKHAVWVDTNQIWVDLDLWSEADDSPAGRPGVWRKYTSTNLVSSLREHGLDTASANSLVAQFRDSRDTRCVDPPNVYTRMPLYPAGFHADANGNAFFTSADSSPLSAAKGDPAPVVRVIQRMFSNEASLFMGWLQGAYMRQVRFAARQRDLDTDIKPVASQTLIICGPPGTGKSRVLLKLVIGALLGAPANMTTAWLRGESHFSDFLLTSALYAADDGVKWRIAGDAEHAAAELKRLGYSISYPVERKGKPALDLALCNERVFIINTDSNSIGAMPSIEAAPDKFLVLHCTGISGQREDYDDDYDAMEKAVLNAIPALAYFLLHEYQPPAWAVKGNGFASMWSQSEAPLNMTRHTVANSGYVSPLVATAICHRQTGGVMFTRLFNLVQSQRFRDCILGKTLTQFQLRGFLADFERKSDPSSPESFGRSMAACARLYPDIVAISRVNGIAHFSFARAEAWEAPSLQSLKVIAEPDPVLQDLANLPSDSQSSPESRDLVSTTDTTAQSSNEIA